MQCVQAFIDSIQEQLDNRYIDISGLEYGLRTAIFSDASKILEAFLNQLEVSDLLTSQGTFHEYRTRKVHGLFGVFELQRGYYKAESGYYSPLDQKLGLIGKYTPGFARMICHAAGTIGSFKEAEKALSLYTEDKVPASQIRAVAQGASCFRQCCLLGDAPCKIILFSIYPWITVVSGYGVKSPTPVLP